ncbi:PLP-dependent aminotransferase family protein [Leucobacter sp. cx-42]|uniref:MocR-like pyridoxine biosynthesis transcription factor PdxR n=1 Tax=unclassified Leucobacter TaxID=2621730 RepID=UPI00165E03A8|nr:MULTISPECIES: PLP-dependent aminotransferase family protein [unclassified Leucobacter]MBC9953061.1 PLP-dependent aminotransferase family protein [Leucobacter sp. cx-42]
MQHTLNSAGLPISLDREAEAPLPVQLAAALRDAIDRALVLPGESLPATRALATRLGIARGVVVAAYEQLIGEGYLAAHRGRGTVVNPDLAGGPGSVEHGAGERSAPGELGGAAAPNEPAALGTAPLPLAPGNPIASAIESPAWRAAWRDAAAEALMIAPALGDEGLRAEVADHLRRMRATVRAPEEVIVTAGTRDGLGLLLTALGSTRGRDLVVGVEDPGLPTLRGVASRYGARVVGLPTDAEGLDTARLPEGILDVLIVTPSHQYPLGGSLPLPRRRELLAWAKRTGVVIVEDDFDSELRFTGSPLPALAALDDPVNGSVVLLGTFSRTVAPAISAGYLVAPAHLRSQIAAVRNDLGGPVSAVVQRALARYLASGELRRHTARLLRRYADRRDRVSDLLAGIPGVRVRPMDGGLHAVIEFLPVSEASTGHSLAELERLALDGAAGRGLGVAPLGAYWQRAGAGRSGLVIGMGGSDDHTFVAGLTELRVVLTELFPRTARN